MLNEKQRLVDACKEDPSLIFTYIKQGQYSDVEYILLNNIVSINQLDVVGNDVMTRLLKAKQYDLVIELMKKKNWNVNNQNIEGNTFAHVLSCDNSVMAVKVAEHLTKKSNYIPNIKNNNGDTALDLALRNNYPCLAFKILEDKRFNNISMFSFKNLFNITVSNKLYGKYSKISNLEIIVDSLEKKDLDKELRDLIKYIRNNMEAIKNTILNNRAVILDNIINNSLVEA
ncbi:MAG: hypothetical protein IJI58_00725 [Bacilli bacterium]|nr:hypothetical protein [Bacilli bacterium]